MLARREMLFGALAATLMARPAWAHQRVPQIDPPRLVEFQRGFEPGTIVIESRSRGKWRGAT